MYEQHDVTRHLQKERNAVEMLYRAFSDKNPELLNLAVVDNWNDIPLAPGQGPGREGFKPLLDGFISAFPDVHITIHDLIQVPGKIAVRAEITGTHKGELMGIAATGRRISIRLHEFHELDGDRITTTWHMEDWFAMFQQLGQYPSL